MEKNLNRVLLKDDTCAESLVKALEDREADWGLENSYLYHNFPLYRDEEEASSRANILLISPKHGILVFECQSPLKREGVQAKLPQLVAEKLEQTYSQLFSRLIKSKSLRKNPTALNFSFFPIVYAPGFSVESAESSEDPGSIKYFYSEEDIRRFFESRKNDKNLSQKLVNEILAVIEGSKGILKPKERHIKDADLFSKGHLLNSIETQIANFDRDQKRAALNIVDGPQRIRGLAGSGKTIVLCLKAAIIHVENPEAKILYTFHTKSLYSLIKQLITRFYRQFSEKDPDWTKIHIFHSWGGKNLPGVYYNTATQNGVEVVRFDEAQAKYGSEAFDKICEQLLKYPIKKKYDFSILDEAQDFPRHFYQLCLQITKFDRVIWGYDECQNVLNIKLQDPKETYGRKDDGTPNVDLNAAEEGVANDVVLHVCYRNPRAVLVYAFALGFGLYNERVLQMLENNEHWEDLGFEVLSGNSKTGDEMEITRPVENSPLSLELSEDQIVTAKAFAGAGEECKFVADQIIASLESDLLPEDITVVSLDDRHARLYFDEITRLLSISDVKTFNHLIAPSTNTEFSKKGHITLTTVYRAKGNESGSVYIIGVDSVFRNKDSITERNKLFTAMTRTKAWLTITGVGAPAHDFKKELDIARKHFPKFKFRMPDRREMYNFQRDLDSQHAEYNEIQRQIHQLSKKMGLKPEQLMQQLASGSKKKV